MLRECTEYNWYYLLKAVSATATNEASLLVEELEEEPHDRDDRRMEGVHSIPDQIHPHLWVLVACVIHKLGGHMYTHGGLGLR